MGTQRPLPAAGLHGCCLPPDYTGGDLEALLTRAARCRGHTEPRAPQRQQDTPGGGHSPH